MRSQHTIWHGTFRRMAAQLIALATLGLGLAAPLAVELAPTVSAASANGASSTLCGMAKSGCGPGPCESITPADYATPMTSPRGGARAWLSRTDGVSGSKDTLTGSGWPAFATVEILLATLSHGSIQVSPTPFAQGVAGASGHVTITFKTLLVGECTTKDGRNLGDEQTLFVAQTPDARARISLLYTFHPSPSFGSSIFGMVSGGEVITMTGSGWEAGQAVTITPAFQLWSTNGYPSYDPSGFHQLPTDAFTVTAQPDGTFMTGATIPREPPETQIAFFATANGPRMGDVSVVANIGAIGPNGTPSLTVNRDAAYAGGKVAVTGKNWPENQDIQITYCRGQAQVYCDTSRSEALATIRTDSKGGFTTTVQIPPDAQPGPITIQANALTSPFDYTVYTQTRSFAVLYPFAQAHPRLEMAIQAAPYVAAALLIALLALVTWLWQRQRRRPGVARAIAASLTSDALHVKE